jgi:hypothetical protein
MINAKDNPVAWAMLLYEISDAHEHLAALADQMASNDRIDDEDYAVQIGHAYAHINRAWNGRYETSEKTTNEQRSASSKFPADIEPCG